MITRNYQRKKKRTIIIQRSALNHIQLFKGKNVSSVKLQNKQSIFLASSSVTIYTCITPKFVSTTVFKNYRDNCEKRFCSGNHKQCKTLLKDY